MSDLRALAGEALCVGFAGDSAESAPVERLVELGPCGVVLFARNVTTLEATRELVRTIADAFVAAGKPEPLICVDQEGGRVARLRFGAGLPSMLALAATRDPSLAERAGARLGRDLAAIGANLDFAPVLDLALAPDATALGTRTLGDDPGLVATLGAALVRGIQSTGVAGVAKHFPGHGASDLDPHVASPARDAIGEPDLVPFAAAIAAGVRGVMTAHVAIASLGGAPATISPHVLSHVLRERLAFEGVAFTDCLQMDAIARSTGTSRGGVLALAAGADALVVSHDLDVAFETRDAIVAAIEGGDVPRSRLERAVLRTRALRTHLESAKPQRQALLDGPGDAIAETIARASIVRVRGEGRLDASRPVAVVSFEGSTSDGIASTTGERPSLSLALRRRRFRSEYFRVPADADGAMREMLIEVLGAQRVHGERTLVVLARRAQRYPQQRAMLDELFSREPGAIAVSALEPFDLPCLAPAQHVFATCGDEESSIEALADVLAGRSAATGTLPVRVPV